MATVRFSGELKDAILKNADKTFDSRATAAAIVPEPLLDSQGWLDHIYDTAFAKHLAHLNALPASFLIPQKELRLEEMWLDGQRVKVDVTLQFANVRGMPKSLGKSSKYQLAYLSDWSQDRIKYECRRENVKDVAMFDAFAERERKMRVIDDERKQFRDSVAKLIKEFVTLSPALKAWPPLWDLLPDETKQKHKEISETKRGSTADLSGLDLNTMTANVVVAKITK